MGRTAGSKAVAADGLTCSARPGARPAVPGSQRLSLALAAHGGEADSGQAASALQGKFDRWDRGTACRTSPTGSAPTWAWSHRWPQEPRIRQGWTRRRSRGPQRSRRGPSIGISCGWLEFCHLRGHGGTGVSSGASAGEKSVGGVLRPGHAGDDLDTRTTAGRRRNSLARAQRLG